MKRITIIVFAFVFCSMLLHAQGKITTVHGELVELTSFVKDGIKPTSVAGKEIATRSLGKGGALAILEKGTARLYVVAPASGDSTFLPRVTAYLGAKTFIKGHVTTRNGIRVITVEDIGKSLK